MTQTLDLHSWTEMRVLGLVKQVVLPSIIARRASGGTPRVKFAGTKHTDWAGTIVRSATSTGEMDWIFFLHLSWTSSAGASCKHYDSSLVYVIS